jgi:hypothetical protein
MGDGTKLRDSELELLAAIMPDALKSVDLESAIESDVQRFIKYPGMDAIPALEKGLHSEDPAVRDRADKLINAIKAKQKK